jgi:acyl carrier protein
VLSVDDVVRRLQRLFLQHFHIGAVNPHTDLVETGLLDSLQIVALLAYVEEEFGARLAIDNFELGDLSSLSGLANLVNASRRRVPAPRKASA